MSDEHDPLPLSLEDLFRDGVPKPPVEDFEKLVADLRNDLVAARHRQEALEAETLRRADQLVEGLRAECDRT
jgi:hypothetical protein